MESYNSGYSSSFHPPGDPSTSRLLIQEESARSHLTQPPSSESTVSSSVQRLFQTNQPKPREQEAFNRISAATVKPAKGNGRVTSLVSSLFCSFAPGASKEQGPHPSPLSSHASSSSSTNHRPYQAASSGSKRETGELAPDLLHEAHLNLVIHELKDTGKAGWKQNKEAAISHVKRLHEKLVAFDAIYQDKKVVSGLDELEKFDLVHREIETLAESLTEELIYLMTAENSDQKEESLARLACIQAQVKGKWIDKRALSEASSPAPTGVNGESTSTKEQEINETDSSRDYETPNSSGYFSALATPEPSGDESGSSVEPLDDKGKEKESSDASVKESQQKAIATEPKEEGQVGLTSSATQAAFTSGDYAEDEGMAAKWGALTKMSEDLKESVFDQVLARLAYRLLAHMTTGDFPTNIHSFEEIDNSQKLYKIRLEDERVGTFSDPKVGLDLRVDLPKEIVLRMKKETDGSLSLFFPEKDNSVSATVNKSVQTWFGNGKASQQVAIAQVNLSRAGGEVKLHEGGLGQMFINKLVAGKKLPMKELEQMILVDLKWSGLHSNYD